MTHWGPRALLAVLLLLPVAPAGAQEQPSVTANGAVLWDPLDDLVLLGVDEEVGRPPASTTKVMTVLLALEAGTITDVVTVSARAAELGRVPGGATLNLQAGQQIPMADLLAGLMLRSGNDAAVAVAEHVAGSEDAFVQRMNTRAGELGMDGTEFLNASGLTNDPRHRSSPLDLARLSAVAMEHPEFVEWAGARSLSVPGLGLMENRNELLGRYEGATGVKTGYTNLAGMCLVASATRGDRTLYAVVLGSEASFADTRSMLDHGFDAFDRLTVLEEGTVAGVYRWAHTVVDVVATDPLARTVPAGAQALWRVDWQPAAGLPASAGAAVGRAELVVDGEVVDAAELVTAEAVPAPAAASAPAQVGAATQDALRAFGRLLAVDRPL
jgi:serine-type D-Ala-D-Ala carboxypeptidase (penicillin-binding protein 5/6)